MVRRRRPVSLREMMSWIFGIEWFFCTLNEMIMSLLLLYLYKSDSRSACLCVCIDLL